MFLEWWMIICLFVLFAYAIYDSYVTGTKAGVEIGAEMTLTVLERQKIIRIIEGGEIQGIPPEEKNENNF